MDKLLYNKNMTKEKLLKKRKRDICLVVVFAVLIVGFFTATALTNALTEDDATWSSWLAVLFIMLFITSIALTAVFGNLLKQDNDKLSLIQSGVPEEEVEQKYKEIKEAEQEEQEEKQEQNKRNRRLKWQARSEGKTYYYDGNGNVQINSQPKKSQTKQNSWLDDKPEDHEIFDDPDIDDIVIMDFLDDDEDDFD